MRKALDAIKALLIVLGLFLALVVSPIIIPWICIYVLIRYQRVKKEEERDEFRRICKLGSSN